MQKKVDVPEQKESLLSLLLNNVLKNPYIWAMALTYFFIYVVRQGVTSWFVFYLIKVRPSSPTATWLGMACACGSCTIMVKACLGRQPFMQPARTAAKASHHVVWNARLQ